MEVFMWVAVVVAAFFVSRAMNQALNGAAA